MGWGEKRERLLLVLLKFAIKYYFAKDKSSHILLNTILDQIKEIKAYKSYIHSYLTHLSIIMIIYIGLYK